MKESCNLEREIQRRQSVSGGKNGPAFVRNRSTLSLKYVRVILPEALGVGKDKLAHLFG